MSRRGLYEEDRPGQDQAVHRAMVVQDRLDCEYAIRPGRQADRQRGRRQPGCVGQWPAGGELATVTGACARSAASLSPAQHTKLHTADSRACAAEPTSTPCAARVHRTASMLPGVYTPAHPI